MAISICDITLYNSYLQDAYACLEAYLLDKSQREEIELWNVFLKFVLDHTTKF